MFSRDIQQRRREERAAGELTAEVNLDVVVGRWFTEGKVAAIRGHAERLNLISPRSDALLKRIQNGNIELNNRARNVLKNLLKGLREHGVDLDAL